MPNKNYLAGRRFEYAVKKKYTEMDMDVMRTAGSHGSFDLIAIPKLAGVPIFIQCKVLNSAKGAYKLSDDWQRTPPHPPSTHFLQVLEVSMKDLKGKRHYFNVMV